MTTRKSMLEHDLPLVAKCPFPHTYPHEYQDYDPKTGANLASLEDGTYRVNPKVYHMFLGPDGSPNGRPGVVLVCDESIPAGLAVKPFVPDFRVNYDPKGLR